MTTTPGFGAASARGRLRDLPSEVKLVLASMVLFNVGFYLVVPFLAVHLSEELGFASWIVGLVLGLRTFSQQGMFFLGGSIADRFGRRPVILWGIAIRIVGFGVLAIASSLAAVTFGILLIGFAAALFAPAVESANADIGRQLEDSGVIRRTELFGYEQMSSRLGTVLGPALGAVLLVFPFSASAAVAAILFAGMWIGFYFLFPKTLETGSVVGTSITRVWRVVLGNRRYVVLAMLCSAQFVALAQLYLMLPEQLSLRVGSQDLLGWFYVGAAVLVIIGQRAMVAVAARMGSRAATTTGSAVMAASFLIPAFDPGSATIWPYLQLAAWIALLHLGQMLMVPSMRDTLARIAGERFLGAHFGLLNTIGGCLSLVGTIGVGYLYDLLDDGSVAAATPWLVVAGCIAVPALVLGIWSSMSDAIWPRRLP
ncbi:MULTISPECIES: MFS transporter [unclassified Rhodococcus (in: high G+C Gram-positive bacteria)]|uniref:MFS transporter n=1 Tax=unclassified Rhodococcus (in: high G+C Gram-positive bacteria) TaxID=192944 RepID=UPI0021CEACEC|nr:MULTISPECIES: MFS transporter [unclassified Rhodococcus (in: high G+C Gram-positive bacteria)]MDI9926207.1 MFS transporter [Rhodococcus sp. IEGM 1341]